LDEFGGRIDAVNYAMAFDGPFSHIGMIAEWPSQRLGLELKQSLDDRGVAPAASRTTARLCQPRSDLSQISARATGQADPVSVAHSS